MQGSHALGFILWIFGVWKQLPESLSTALVFMLPSPTFTCVCGLIHSAEISSTWQLRYMSPHCAIAQALEILAGHQDKGERNKSSWYGCMTDSHYEML
jgi:hypothetical protein